MIQQSDEPFRTFAARVQGKAETCEFKTTYNGTCSGCQAPYTGETYYTNERIRDVLLNGIADLDIRREALSADDINKRSINDVISFIEARETARNANPSANLSAASEYKKRQRSHQSAASTIDHSKTAQCCDCKATYHLFHQMGFRGWNKKAFEP